MTELSEIRRTVERAKGKREEAEAQISRYNLQIKDQEDEIEISERAQKVIQMVARTTQQELEYRLSEIATLGLESVFNDPYTLNVTFDITGKGNTKCDLFFERAGKEFDPLKESGGGTADIAALGLKTACWSISQPRPRNTLIDDEPFKHIKGAADNLRALTMIREISRQLDLQIIMVSDERASLEEIRENSDKVFRVEKRDEISYVEEI